MTYLLDTNAWIQYLNEPEGLVAKRLLATNFKLIRLCSIVKAELFFGAFKSQRKEQNLELLREVFAEFESAAFDDRCAQIYGEVRSSVGEARKANCRQRFVDWLDSLANDLTVVTHNSLDFEKISGLQIEDWQVVE